MQTHSYLKKKTIKSTVARRRFGQLLEKVYYNGDAFVVERRGEPMAAVVPLKVYDNWQEKRKQFFRMVDQVRDRNRNLDIDEVERDVKKAIQEVRRQKSKK